MDQQHGEVELTLQFTQVPQQRRDLFGCIFVGAVQADEGIQDQEHGLDRRHRFPQTFPVLRQIQQQSRGRDYVEGQIL